MNHSKENCPQAERLASLEVTDKFIMQKIDGLDKKVDDNHQEQKNLINGLSSQIAELDKKFAPKWVELAMKSAIGVIVGGVIVAVLNSVIK